MHCYKAIAKYYMILAHVLGIVQVIYYKEWKVDLHVLIRRLQLKEEAT